MKILITGISGFLGSALSDRALAQGIEVIKLPGINHASNWRFGDAVDYFSFAKIDAVYHLAHDFSGESGGFNSYSGTVNLVHGLNMAGVKSQFFVSSLSARSDAISNYGKIKYSIEQAISSLDGVFIVRPGLILGNAGIYGRIKKWVSKFSIVPLPDGGKGLVACIGVDELCDALLALLNKQNNMQKVACFCDPPVTLASLVKKEAKNHNKRILIINIPSKFLIKILKFFEFIKLPMPVSSDNLLGFLCNQHAVKDQK